MPATDLIARILIIQENQILLTHEIGTPYTFLPGGHIEYNEPAKQTILREMREEFKGEGQVKEFIGAIEHSYNHRGEPQHEVTLLFEGRLLNITYPRTPNSLESHLEFLWKPLDRLAEANILPRPLMDLIPKYCAGPTGSLWASTIEEESKA